MSLPRDVVAALTRPGAFFEDRTPSLKHATWVVLAVALLSAVGLVATGFVLGGAVSGTAIVENPEHVSGPVCERPSAYDEGGVWEERNWTEPYGCTVPPTMEIGLGGHAQGVLVGAALPAFLAVPFGWLLAAAAFYVLTPGGRENGGIGDVLAYAGWGFLPLGVLGVLRPVVVWLAAPFLAFPDRPAALGTYVMDMALGFAFAPLAALTVLVVAWQAYVLVHAVHAARDVSLERAAFRVAGAMALALAVVVVDPLPGPSRPGGLAFLGFVALGLGLLWAYVPGPLIMLDTRFELFGMRNTRDVEPADWYVALHRGGGLLTAAFGFLLAGGFEYVV